MRNTDDTADKRARSKATIDRNKLWKHIEFYGSGGSDPHQINTAVYVALFAIWESLSPSVKSTSARKKKTKSPNKL